MEQRKLLLADDSITIQKVVNLTFADEGIEVITANDGNAAMEKLGEISPDLVMADVNMPGLSGYEICQRIKQNQETRKTPVILLVGSFEPFDEERARQVGADDFLTKPFQSIRQLVSKVSDLLQSAEKAASAPDFQDTLEMPPPHPHFIQPTETQDDEMIQTEQVGAREEKKTPIYGEQAGIEEDSAQAASADQSDAGDVSFASSESQPSAETTFEPVEEENQFARPHQSAETEEAETAAGESQSGQAPDVSSLFDFDDMNLLEIPPFYTEEPAETEEETQAREVSESSTEAETELPTEAELKETDLTDWQATQTPETDYQPSVKAPSAQTEAVSEQRQLKEQVGSQVSAYNFPPEVIDAIAEKVVEKLSARLKE